MQYNFYYNNRRDSLGPITGSMLKAKMAPPQTVVLGNLENTITAKEIKYLNRFLRDTFPSRLIVTIDAAVGDLSDVGVIKVSDAPLSPGSGVNKRLGKVGDISVQGVVAEKNFLSKRALAEVRMKMVYKMSDVISDAIAEYFVANALAL